jgi:uncharacterized delta-60 repeat protein
MKSSGLLLSAAVALVAAAIASAAPGDLDPTFSDDGKVYLNGYFATDLAVQADGSTVVVGDAFIARVTSSGKLDNGFGKKGYIPKPFNRTSSATPNAVAIQPDGKIVVAGAVDRPTSPFESDVALARYLPDGSPDPSFDGDGVATLSTFGADRDEAATDVAIQPDGKIAVAGTAGGSGIIARFNPDGTPDTAFSGDGFLTSGFGFPGVSLAAIGLGPSASLYAAGVAFKGTDDSDMVIVRVDATGASDPGFDTDGIASVDFGDKDGARALAVQADGNVVAAGSTKSGAAFARLSPAGAPDPAFGGDGLVTSTALGSARALGLGEGGTIYAIGGGVDTIRLLANGELDTSFSGDGVTSVSLGGAFAVDGEALAVAADGRVMIAGSALLSKDDSVIGVSRLKVAPGPPDADADKVRDPKDDCPLQGGPKKLDGCPLVKRKLTLAESHGFFHGQIRVSSPGTDLVSVAYRRCLFEGKVTVYESRHGADKKLGSSGAGSAWTVKEKVGNGDYYARLKPQVYQHTSLCGGAKSNTLRG